jgi:hypothetical protein
MRKITIASFMVTMLAVSATLAAHIGKYEGSTDAAGRALTLEGEMPSPFDPARSVRVREVIELKSRDQKVVTTSLQGEDGNWFTLVTVNARRKKEVVPLQQRRCS